MTEETDRELLIRIGRKFAIILVIILFFDSIFDLLSGLIDLLLEVLHLLVEFFEYTLEILLEHLLGTNHHEGEIIIANIVILVVLYGLVRFCCSI